jgi:hypothetical protein
VTTSKRRSTKEVGCDNADVSGQRRREHAPPELPAGVATGPARISWPEALELLSAELGEPVTFRVAAERQFLKRLTDTGVPAGEAELLITREWAILAGENDYTTGTFEQIPGRPHARSPSSFTTTARNSSDARAPSSPIPLGGFLARSGLTDRREGHTVGDVVAGRPPFRGVRERAVLDRMLDRLRVGESDSGQAR